MGQTRWRPRVVKRIIIITALALFGFVAYGIYDAGRNERPTPLANTNISFSKGRASGQRVKFRSWSADYDKIVSNADQTILDIQNVRNGTIFKNGKPYMHVRAAHMTVNTITHDFAETGPMHAETVGTVPARTFDTDSAVWNDALQTLTLAKRVVIHSGSDDPLTVGSLTLDIKTGAVDIHDVEGPVRIK